MSPIRLRTRLAPPPLLVWPLNSAEGLASHLSRSSGSAFGAPAASTAAPTSSIFGSAAFGTPAATPAPAAAPTGRHVPFALCVSHTARASLRGLRCLFLSLTLMQLVRCAGHDAVRCHARSERVPCWRSHGLQSARHRRPACLWHAGCHTSLRRLCPGSALRQQRWCVTSQLSLIAAHFF